jgi:hypothetical protein
VDRVVSPIDPSTLLGEARRELKQLPGILNALLENMDDATARTRPQAGEWAPVEIVCHLRDEETDDFGARVRVILEGGVRFTPIDPAGWALARGYRDADPGAVAIALTRRDR